MGNNTSVPAQENKKVGNNVAANIMASNNVTSNNVTSNNVAVASTPNEQMGGKRRRSRKNRRQSRKIRHRKRRGGAAGLTLRYPKNRAFTPTGPSFTMNNPTFRPELAVAEPEIRSLSEANLINTNAFTGIDMTAAALNEVENRASFGPSPVRKNRKNRSRKNRRN